jgi:hypothetical protein
MLGDLVYEAQGKVAGYRVLDIEEGPKDRSYHYTKWNFERRNRSNRYSDVLEYSQTWRSLLR